MLQLEHVPIDSLIPASYNPSRMADAQMAALMRSLDEFGWVQPVIVNTATGTIVGGHQRVEAAKRLGHTTAPVVYVDLDEGKEKALNVGLNKIHGDWDMPKLAELLDGFAIEDVALTGFTADEIDNLLAEIEAPAEPAEALTDPDDVPEPPAEPITKPGDVWILGRHRLLCGDSTSVTDVERLMDGTKADMVWTDPPYGVSYVGKTKDALTIQNDSLDDNQLETFLRDALGNAYAACRAGAVWYVAAPPGPLHQVFSAVLKDLGVWRQTLNWVKNTFALGRSDYHYRHEPIFYGWVEGEAHYYCGDRTQDTIWEFPKPARNGEHPTMKPVELIERSLNNSSKPKWSVLDLFGGSGSTLIAAERTGRTAYLMELDPHYCDVIVKRWEQHTGQTARLEGSDAQETTKRKAKA